MRDGNGVAVGPRARRPGAFLLGLLLAVAAAPQPAVALDPNRAITQYVHDIWQTERGLPQNTILAMLQTRDGYLWLGTQDGLARFDGARFAVFDTRNTPELGNNDVLALLEDRASRLWIGTNGGGLVCLEAGRFTRLTRAAGLPGDSVRALLEDRSGRLWVGTLGGGLLRLENGRLVRDPWTERLPGRRVRALLEDAKGVLWVGTDAGLARVENDTVTLLGRKDGLSHESVLGLLEDRQGILWIATEGGGVGRLQAGKLTTFTTKQGLSDDFVWSLAEDRDGNLWIGTQGGGLNRLKDGRLSTLTTKQGLSIDFVRSLYEDREGSLWVGTYGGGLNRLRDGRVLALTAREGLTNDSVHALYEDRAGRLWIGTQRGLNRLEDGRVEVLAAAPGLSNGFVRSLAEDREGGLWIGTQGGGVNRLKDGRLSALTTRQGLANDIVLALQSVSDGSLWIGTRGGGLNRLKDGKLSALTTKDGLSNDDIRSLYEGRDGSLWIGTNGGGLNRLRDGKLSALTSKNGLSNDFVWSLLEDQDGGLWIGTEGGGLNRLKDGKLSAIGTKQGLFDDDVFAILEDASGRLWMTCNKGISYVSKHELQEVLDGRRARVACVSFGTADGMRRPDCNGASQPAAWKGRDGRLFFATTLGVVIVDPTHLPENRLEPPVMIEEVLVDGRVADRTAALRLPPGTHTLEVHYTALSLLVPERVRFKYRLEGFDEAWVDPGTRRTAYYTNLPHGAYSFRVIASNNDGLWNNQGAALGIVVEPRLHETLAFRLLVVALFALAGPLFYRYRMRRLERQTAELERLVAARTAEVGAANAQLAQLSREDALTGVANRRRLDETLGEEWRRAARLRTPLAFLLIDVDFFKAYNDHLGHLAGDACLQAVARALASAHQRAGELVARYGGEEFAVVIAGLTREAALATAEDARRRVAALALPHPASKATSVVTVSVGMAWIEPGGDATSADLVGGADRALYRAKAGGRNRVESELLAAPPAALT